MSESHTSKEATKPVPPASISPDTTGVATEASSTETDDAERGHTAPSRGEQPVRVKKRTDVSMELSDTEEDPGFARLMKSLDDMQPEQKKRLREETAAQGVDEKAMAKMLAEQGVPEEKARKILQKFYDMSESEAAKITGGKDLQKEFDAVDPAPVKLTPAEKAAMDELQELGQQAEQLITQPPGKERDTALAGFQERMRDILDKKPVKFFGKFLGYSVLGGLLGLLFLMIIHTSGNQR